MCDKPIPLPSVINEKPTLAYIRSLEGVERAWIALKVARNIHIRCKLAEAQNWKCCWCGIECRPEPNFTNSATIEHVHPRSLGGENHWDNYAMACAYCNNKRGTMPIEDFMAGKIPDRRPKKDRKQNHMTRRMRKYRKHVEKFNCRGWTRNDRSYDPEMWLSSLQCTDVHRAELRELIVV